MKAGEYRNRVRETIEVLGSRGLEADVIHVPVNAPNGFTCMTFWFG